MNSLQRFALLLCFVLAVGVGIPVASQAGGTERLLELQRQQGLLNAQRGQPVRQRELKRSTRPVSRLNRFGRYGTVFVERQGSPGSVSRARERRPPSLRSPGISGRHLRRGGALR
jgi:hypothetical protein